MNQEQYYYSVSLTDLETRKEYGFAGIVGNIVRLRDYIEVGPVQILEISLPELYKFDFKSRLYLKGFEFNYKSLLRFEIESVLKISNLQVAADKIMQWGYNSRSIAVYDKQRILKYITETAINDPDEKFNPIFTMSAIFHQRIVFHPDFSNKYKYYQFIFDALEEDGLIKKSEFSYRITPKAITALQTYEEENRRHNDAVSLQRILGIFAFISAVSGAAQAYFSYKGLP